MKITYILRKTPQKIAATRAALFDSNMHQIVCRQTPLGELTALPRPHSCIQVATSKGEKIKGRERYSRRGDGREGKGREGRAEERAGEEGKGRKREGPHDTLAWGPQCLNPALMPSISDETWIGFFAWQQKC